MKTSKRDSSEQKRDSVTRDNPLKGSVTVSRHGGVTKHARHVTVTVRPEGRPVTVTRLANQDAAGRFASWLAGCSAEQQARWERAQKDLDANPVQDKQLPPALRDGALEVF